MREEVYWLALQQKYWLIPAYKLDEAIKKLGSIEKLWEADEEQLAKLGLSSRTIRKFIEYRNQTDLYHFEKLYDEILRNGVMLIRCTDKEYPSKLKNIGLHAPRLLFYRGSDLNFNNCVAIGGRRSCSENGRKQAYNISRKLAENGYTIVSGLAIGVDTEAHKGALDAGGKTIAVLAWLDPIYPPVNLELARRIEKQGAILSECYKKPPKNLKWRFVERNKLISGLSDYVIIVEGRAKGGSLSLAQKALSQGKDVFILKPETSDKEIHEDCKSLVKKLEDKDKPKLVEYEELLEFFTRHKPKTSYQASLTTL